MRPSRRLFLSSMPGAALAAACSGTDPSNASPSAAFTVGCNRLECTFDNGSTDVDGTVQAWVWDFGDGGTSAEQDATHAYTAPGGEFSVTLTVTDDGGATATAVKQVNVSERNAAPLAGFNVSCTGLTCSFIDRSTDPDAGGSVASRAWDFGDGGTSVEPSPTHIYAAPGGLFTVTLTVTDDGGDMAKAVKRVNATPGTGPGRAGTYERETPHQTPGHDSRYVIRSDGRFELHDEKESDTTVYTGRWRFPPAYSGVANEPDALILLDFDGFQDDGICGGEGLGSFLLDGHLAIAYCWVMIQAGLEEGVYTTDPGPGSSPPLSQDGQIAFVRDGRIYRANTDGNGLIQLSTGPGDDWPAWSPDATRIAFTRTSGETTGVFIMDVDGSNVVQRATSGGVPTWSPDGEWIAYACQEGICKVSADDDGTGPVVVHERRGIVQDPAWSPDGARIAFTSDWAMFDFWFDIWLIASDGTQPTVLRTHTPQTPNPDAQYQPAWSPDGRRIAHVECPWAFFTCSSSVISVMNANGSGLTRLAATSGFARPTWSPDGQLIAFASPNGIEWVSADGSRRGRILGDGHSPAWRP
jgi:hypothetical protein